MGTTTYISDDEKIQLLKDTVNYIQTNMKRITPHARDPPETKSYIKRAKFLSFKCEIDNVSQTLKFPFSLTSVTTQAKAALDKWNLVMKFGTREGQDFAYHVSLLSQIIDLFKNHHDDVWTKEDGQKIYNRTQHEHYMPHPHHAAKAHSPRVPEPPAEPVESVEPVESGGEHLNALLLQLKDLCE